MIPRAHIQQWSAFAPWPDLRQVEQDLIISRALCGEAAAIAAFGRVWQELISRLPGDSWKSTPAVIATIRATKYPSLLA